MNTPLEPAPTPIDFSRQLLLAMPGVVGGSLDHAVIYICEHNQNGALGLVINRPTDLTLAELLSRVTSGQLDNTRLDPEEPVFFGGPIQTDRGFVLHTPAGSYASSITLGDLVLTSSKDVLQDVADGRGPEHLIVTLGYAGWGAGQLEHEMAQNAWINVASSDTLLFHTPAEQRYSAALAQLGINPTMLAGEVGHA